MSTQTEIKIIVLTIGGKRVEATEQELREAHAAIGKLLGLPAVQVVERIVDRPYYVPPAPVLTFPEPLRPSWTGTEVMCGQLRITN